MESLISRTISSISLKQFCNQKSFAPLVACGCLHKTDFQCTFILDDRTCQIHVIYPDAQQCFISKVIFLTPQPTSMPICLSMSPCGCFLALITKASVHVVDLTRIESTLKSSQTKIIAKLNTVFGSFSNESSTACRIVRVRWHPLISGVLTILTEAGKLLFYRCYTGNSFKFEQSLFVLVLEQQDECEEIPTTDKANKCSPSRKQGINLDLSAAMGAVCSDFDFGSSFFSAESKLTREAVLCMPIYIICENGDILLVSPSPSSLNKPLIRVVRILLSSEDCYTFDFDSLICLRAPQSTGSPDVICFSNRTGRIFHGICLHVPQADLQSNSRTQGRSVPIIYLIDSVDLDLPTMRKSFSADDANEDADENESPVCDQIVLLPASHCLLDNFQQYSSSYLCVHPFGIHHVVLPWAENIFALSSKPGAPFPTGIGVLLKERACSVEHLLMTRGLRAITEGSDYVPGRTVIGFLSSGNTTANSTTAVRVLFSSKPEVVTVPLPDLIMTSTSFSPSHSERRPAEVAPAVAAPNEDGYDSWPSTPNHPGKSSSQLESGFVKKCRAMLAEAASSRFPIISAHDDGTVCSPDELLRSFLRSTEALRTSSQLACLAELTVAVGGTHADHVEATVAAQAEEVDHLSSHREALQERATAITERHALVLERQESLNNRLSELARRLHSIEGGLTDAEFEMRNTVETIRDRLKSGLLGWLENIRLQYKHLVECRRERNRQQQYLQQSPAATSPSSPALKGSAKKSSSAAAVLSPSQIQSLAEVLKTEGSEIDSLIRTVEKINISMAI